MINSQWIKKLPKYPDIQYVERDLRTGNLDKILGDKIIFEPKYDGSNIRLAWVGGKILISSRKKEIAVEPFISGFFEAFSGYLDELKKVLQRGYVLFCELYGYKNTPQGIHKRHQRAWDHIIFDVWREEQGFLPPEEARKVVGKLKFVEFYVDSAESFEELIEKAQKYSKYEGVVIKRYVNGQLLATKWKPEEIKEGILPKSEILGCINKAHLVLGDEIFNTKKAMRLIWRFVKEEARKHGFKLPSSDYVYRLLNLYLVQIKGDEK